MKTTHEYRGFVFTIEFAFREPAYIVDYPDIPDIITSGVSLDEAFHNACEALDLYLEMRAKFNNPPVTPKRKLQVVAA